MIIFSCEKGCENMNYVKYHMKKSVKVKLQGQKRWPLPPLDIYSLCKLK